MTGITLWFNYRVDGCYRPVAGTISPEVFGSGCWDREWVEGRSATSRIIVSSFMFVKFVHIHAIYICSYTSHIHAKCNCCYSKKRNSFFVYFTRRFIVYFAKREVTTRRSISSKMKTRHSLFNSENKFKIFRPENRIISVASSSFTLIFRISFKITPYKEREFHKKYSFFSSPSLGDTFLPDIQQRQPTWLPVPRGKRRSSTEIILVEIEAISWTADGLSSYIVDFGSCPPWIIETRSIWAHGCFLSLPGIRDLSKCPGCGCVNYGSSGASPESGIIIIIKRTRPYTSVPPVSLVPLVSHLTRNRRLDRFFGITRFARPRAERNDRTDGDRMAEGIRDCVIIPPRSSCFPRHLGGTSTGPGICVKWQIAQKNLMCLIATYFRSGEIEAVVVIVTIVVAVFVVDSRPTATHDAMDRWSILERSISLLS